MTSLKPQTFRVSFKLVDDPGRTWEMTWPGDQAARLEFHNQLAIKIGEALVEHAQRHIFRYITVGPSPLTGALISLRADQIAAWASEPVDHNS